MSYVNLDIYIKWIFDDELAYGHLWPFEFSFPLHDVPY
jgi:hypothetical protein